MSRQTLYVCCRFKGVFVRTHNGAEEPLPRSCRQNLTRPEQAAVEKEPCASLLLIPLLKPIYLSSQRQ